MFYSLITSVLFIAFIPRPVFLVLVASALAFFVAPVIYYFNLYYCLTVIPKEDRVFYPSPFARWFGALSLLIFTGISIMATLPFFSNWVLLLAGYAVFFGYYLPRKERVEPARLRETHGER